MELTLLFSDFSLARVLGRVKAFRRLTPNHIELEEVAGATDLNLEQRAAYRDAIATITEWALSPGFDRLTKALFSAVGRGNRKVPPGLFGLSVDIGAGMGV